MWRDEPRRNAHSPGAHCGSRSVSVMGKLHCQSVIESATKVKTVVRESEISVYQSESRPELHRQQQKIACCQLSRTLLPQRERDWARRGRRSIGSIGSSSRPAPPVTVSTRPRSPSERGGRTARPLSAGPVAPKASSELESEASMAADRSRKDCAKPLLLLSSISQDLRDSRV